MCCGNADDKIEINKHRIFKNHHVKTQRGKTEDISGNQWRVAPFHVLIVLFICLFGLCGTTALRHPSVLP